MDSSNDSLRIIKNLPIEIQENIFPLSPKMFLGFRLSWWLSFQSHFRPKSNLGQRVKHFLLLQLLDYIFAHSPHCTSACFKTRSMASCCLSGGYLYFLKIRRTTIRKRARTLSRTCQSTVVLLRSFSVISVAIFFNISSPNSRTALSLLANAR